MSVGGDTYVGVSSWTESERDARAAALGDARRQIVDYLGVQVKSEYVERIEYRQKGDTSSEDVEMSQVLHSLAKAVVQVREDRVKIVRCRADDETVKWKAWALVNFDETRHRRFVDSWVRETERLAEDLLADAEEDAGSEPSAAISALIRAATLLNEVEQSGGLYPAAQGKLKALRERSTARLNRLLAGIVVTKRGEGQIGAAGSGLVSPLVVVLTTAAGVPVVGHPVHFRFKQGKGALDEVVRTDARGQAASTVRDLSAGGDKWIVAARLLDRATRRLLRVASDEVLFSIRAGRGRMLTAVVVRGWTPDSLPSVPIAAALREALAARGVDMAGDAHVFGTKSTPAADDRTLRDLARRDDASSWLRIAVTSDPPRPGPLGGDSVFVSVRVVVTLTDTASNEARMTLSLPNNAYPDWRGYGFGRDAGNTALADALGARTMKLYPQLVSSLADAIDAATQGRGDGGGTGASSP